MVIDEEEKKQWKSRWIERQALLHDNSDLIFAWMENTMHMLYQMYSYIPDGTSFEEFYGTTDEFSIE